jgi:hypothetical protein
VLRLSAQRAEARAARAAALLAAVVLYVLGDE